MNKDLITCDPATGVCKPKSERVEPGSEAVFCDTDAGTCHSTENTSGAVADGSELPLKLENDKPFQMIYVTDPLCCYCWEVEPELRKFVAHYGHLMNTRILMGGLLESWDGFADEGNSIHDPSDVGEHWREAAARYGMPIDGTVWDKDPIQSSYPASIAYKLVQKISTSSSRRFLRAVREEVMLANRNISRDDVLINILDRNDRNGKKLVEDTKTAESRQLLEEDLQLSRQLGARSFPTVILINEGGDGIRVTGMNDFASYESALQNIAGDTVLEPAPLPELKDLFDLSRNLFFQEIETIYELEPQEVEPFVIHNLPEGSYEIREAQGSRYLIRK